MKTIKTFCRICEPACGLQAQVDNEEVVKILPDKEHPVLKGFACHKGVNFLQVHNDPDRLNQPLKRLNPRSEAKGEFAEVDWDSAIEDIAQRLQLIQERYGKGAVAGYKGNPAGFNTRGSRSLASFFKKIGVTKAFGAVTQDCANKPAGSEAVYGTNSLHPIPDLLHTDYFLSLGCNPKVSHMSVIQVADPMAKIKAINKRGGKVVFVNPRKIESSTPATGEVLLIKPDTDVYFLAALIQHITSAADFDLSSIDAPSKNLEGLLAFVSDYSPERVASVTGIDAQTIRQVAEDFASAKAASVHMSTGVNMGRQGTLAYWLLNMLSLVTGNLGKRGGNVYSAGAFPAPQFGLQQADDPFFDTPFGEVRTIAGELPGNLLSEYIALEEGVDSDETPVRALIVYAGNPLLSIGGETALKQAFEKLELLVVIDIFRNATGEMADYVLPGTDWLEREDINTVSVGLQLEPFVQYTDKAVAPKAGRRDEWWIIARLEQAMSLPSLLDNESVDSFRATDKMLALNGLSVEALKRAPGNVLMLPASEPGDLFTKGLQHTDGLIDCCPPVLQSSIVVAKDIFAELEAETPEQLKLISLRTNYMHNSWLSNVEKLKRGVHVNNPLWMNPEDAESRQLSEGAVVFVRSDHGEILAEIAFDKSLRTGVVAMSHGWGNGDTNGMRIAQKYPGVNVNKLLPSGPSSYEKISNQAHMTGINVEVSLTA